MGYKLLKKWLRQISMLNLFIRIICITMLLLILFIQIPTYYNIIMGPFDISLTEIMELKFKKTSFLGFYNNGWKIYYKLPSDGIYYVNGYYPNTKLDKRQEKLLLKCSNFLSFRQDEKDIVITSLVKPAQADRGGFLTPLSEKDANFLQTIPKSIQYVPNDIETQQAEILELLPIAIFDNRFFNLCLKGGTILITLVTIVGLIACFKKLDYLIDVMKHPLNHKVFSNISYLDELKKELQCSRTEVKTNEIQTSNWIIQRCCFTVRLRKKSNLLYYKLDKN